ncbi:MULTISPECIES: phosphoenolpyruvate hydrolase family protein [Pacificibacter]|uniref:phosphoenolpyruvate hydrolase family protein n=1 Tax=Pacificibacter TaxID=1042323 RepID=UPI001C09A353|nr:MULTISPECIES: phosphoenolpyruvate hydrolase family protein [Pacificibacter]MBU2936372.1 phosphoenolpyruvate hydrolase family protein [Pacificibacter marinus]MDO6617337.1 phosphoenolpyruvate hydrolase family protein [Pacificibacter sp. 1_MG-2023]
MAVTGREEILKKLRAKVVQKQVIVGGGAGTGLSAKCEEAGGIDLIVIYNSGRYRMAGRGSLAGYMSYGNANEIVVDMGREVLPVVKNVPVLAGVNATDPFCIMDSFLDELAGMGFAGIQNFPTVGIIDGRFRQELEATGMSYEMEVETIAKARARNLLTTPYVFSADNAAKMAQAGADVIVAHFGLTAGGSIGAQDSAPRIEECARLYNEWTAAAREHRDDLIFICHGGPLAEPQDAQQFLDLCPDCHGFYGASSMERLPTERAITEQTAEFVKLRLGAMAN